jgi:hypothetical protein
MPTSALKSLAKRAKVSQDKAEAAWNKAKAIVDRDYPKGVDYYYPLVMGITKRMLGISESVGLTEFLILSEANPAYFKGLNKQEKAKMAAEIERFSKMDSDDPKAYPEDWTADKSYRDRVKKLPKSRHTKKYQKRFSESLNEGNSDVALKKKAEDSGIKMSILKDVWKRGMAAWRTGHRPGVGQHQWAMARVNSFIVGGPARKADKDLWDKRNK